MESPYLKNIVDPKATTQNPNINTNIDNLTTGAIKAPVSPFLDSHIKANNPKDYPIHPGLSYEKNDMTPMEYYYGHTTDFTGYREQLGGDVNVRWNHNDNDIQSAIQPMSEKWGNAGVQFVGTFAGEILTMAGAILKIPEAVRGAFDYAVTGEATYFDDMFNGVGGQLMEWGIGFQDYIKDEFEIKTSIADQTSFNITSGSWWASNAPAIASAVSSMIAPLGVVKGIGMIGKALTKGAAKLALKSAKNIVARNAMKHLGKAMKSTGGALQTGLSEKIIYTAISTHSDIFIETAHGFKDKKEEFIELGYTEQEANKFAGEWAANSYIQGVTVGLAFNILESRLMLGRGSRFGKVDSDIEKILNERRIGKMTNTVDDIAAKGIADAKNDILGAISKRTAKDGLKTTTLTMLNEGFEEMRVDFIMNEADRNVRINNGMPVFDAGSNVFNRIVDHLSEGKNWTSGLFGAIGGGATQIATAKKRNKQETMVQNEYMQSVLDGVEKIDGIVSEYASVRNTIFPNKQSNGTDDVYIKTENNEKVVATPVQDIVQTLMSEVDNEGGVHIDAYLDGLMKMSDTELLTYMGADAATYDIAASREFINNVKSEIEIAKDTRNKVQRKYKTDISDSKENKILFESALTYAVDYNNRVIARIDNELNEAATNNIPIKDIKNKLKQYPKKYKNYIKAKTQYSLKVKELQDTLDSIEKDSKKAYSFVSPNEQDIVQLESDIKLLESQLETAILTASTGDKRDMSLISNATEIAKQIESKRIAIRGIKELKDIYDKGQQLGNAIFEERSNTNKAIHDRINKEMAVLKLAFDEANNAFFANDNTIDPNDTTAINEIDNSIDSMIFEYNKDHAILNSIKSEFTKENKKHTEHIESIADGRYDEFVKKAQDIKNEINGINNFNKFKSAIDKTNTSVDLDAILQRVETTEWYANSTDKAKMHITERIAKRRKEIENANNPNSQPIAEDPISKGITINGNIIGIDSTGNHYVYIPDLFNEKSKVKYTVGDIIYIQGIKYTILNINANSEINTVELVVKDINNVVKIIDIDIIIESALLEAIQEMSSSGKTMKVADIVKIVNGVDIYINKSLNSIDLFKYIIESGFDNQIRTVIEVLRKNTVNKRTQSIYNQLNRYLDTITLYENFIAKFKAYSTSQGISTDGIEQLALTLTKLEYFSTNTANIDNAVDVIINDVVHNNTYGVSPQVRLQLQSMLNIKTGDGQTLIDPNSSSIIEASASSEAVTPSGTDTSIVTDVVERNSFTENAVMDYKPTDDYFTTVLTPNQIEHFKKVKVLIQSMLSVSVNSKLTPINIMEYIYSIYPSQTVFTESVYSIIFDILLFKNIHTQSQQKVAEFEAFVAKNPEVIELLNELNALIGEGYTDIFYNKETINSYFDRLSALGTIAFDGVRSEFDLFTLIKNIDPNDTTATVEVTVFKDGNTEKTILSVEDIYNIQNELENATTFKAHKITDGYALYHEYKGNMIQVSRVKNIKSANVKMVNGQIMTPIQSEPFRELVQNISSDSTINVHLNGKRFAYTMYNEFKALHSLIETYHNSPSDYNREKLISFITATVNAHSKIKSTSVFSYLVNSVADFDYQEILATNAKSVKFTDYINDEYINNMYEFTSQVFRNKEVKNDNTPINKVPSINILNSIANSLPSIVTNFKNQYTQRNKLNNTLVYKSLHTVYISKKSNGSNNLVDTTESIDLLTATNVKKYNQVPIAYYSGVSDADPVAYNMSPKEREAFLNESNAIRKLYGSNALFYTYIKHPSGRISPIPIRIASANVISNMFAKQHMDHIWSTIFDAIRVGIVSKQPINGNSFVFEDKSVTKDEILADMSDIIATGNNNKGNSFFNFSYDNNILTIEYIDSNRGNGSPSDNIVNIYFNKSGIPYKYDRKINNGFVETSLIRYKTDNPIAEAIEAVMYLEKGPNILNTVHAGVNVSKGKLSNAKVDGKGNPIERYKTLPAEAYDRYKSTKGKYIPIHQYYSESPATYANEVQYYIESGYFITNIRPIVNEKGKVVSYITPNGKYKPVYNITASSNVTLEYDDFNRIVLGYSSATDAIADFINHSGEFAQYSYKLFNTYYENGKIVDASNEIANFIKSLSRKGRFALTSDIPEIQLTHSKGNIGINKDVSTKYKFTPNEHIKLIYHEILHKTLTEQVSNKSLKENMNDLVYVVRSLEAISRDESVTQGHRNNVTSFLKRIFAKNNITETSTNEEIISALNDNRSWQELFTYAFTNRYIADTLNKLDYKGIEIKERKSFWDRIVEIFIKLININIREGSYLKALKGISSNIINNGNTNNTGNHNEIAGLPTTPPPVAITPISLDNDTATLNSLDDATSETVTIDNLDIQFVNDYNPTLLNANEVWQQGAELYEAQNYSLTSANNSLHLQIQSSIDIFRTNQTTTNTKIC